MRLLIDCQGAQGSSANRGIGRYTLHLVEKICEIFSDGEVILLLNGDLQGDQHQFYKLAMRSKIVNIQIWKSLNPQNEELADISRKTKILSLRPDAVLTTSLFENPLSGPAISLFHDPGFVQAVVLYDLIPLVYQDVYLPDLDARKNYIRKAKSLSDADCILTISQATLDEAIELLSIDEHKFTNISASAEESLTKNSLSQKQITAIRERLGIPGEFILYTGGTDFRKNIDGLINAYGKLSVVLQEKYKLVVVCDVSEIDRERIYSQIRKLGIETWKVILTGYIPDVDLQALYKSCSLFVFPSLHEGFGLPVLEAIHAGAPVIASNTSSLPEILDFNDALFDPSDPDSIAAKIELSLLNEKFRTQLLKNSSERSQIFSWEKTAKSALGRIEKAVNSRTESTKGKKRLALVTPLPPEKSGISYYSLEILSSLRKYYDITLVLSEIHSQDSTTWDFPTVSKSAFVDQAHNFDRVLYQFGNSSFHSASFDLLETIPGVVTLHDFYLSGVLQLMSVTSGPSNIFNQALFESHGYSALAEKHVSKDISVQIRDYPSNLPVLKEALAIVTHSSAARAMAKGLYGTPIEGKFQTIPLVRSTSEKMLGKQDAKMILGLPLGARIVSSFGFVAESKASIEILEAFKRCHRGQAESLYLVFVGESNGHYGKQLLERIRALDLDKHVHITGWVSDEDYIKYLAASDIAIQLRRNSRGESSYSVLDAIAASIPLIVNEGSFSEGISSEIAIVLPENFSIDDLSDSLVDVLSDSKNANIRAGNALEYLSKNHSPERCSQEYFRVIEAAYNETNLLNHLDYKTLSQEKRPEMSINHWAEAVSFQRNVISSPRQIFIEIENPRHSRTGSSEIGEALKVAAQLKALESKIRIEPIFWSKAAQAFIYARSWLFMAAFGLEINDLDTEVEFQAEDFVLIQINHRVSEKLSDLIDKFEIKQITFRELQDMVSLRAI